MRIIVAVIFCFVLVGCTTVHFYDGNEKPESELTLVSSSLSSVKVISIDGVKNDYNPGTYRNFYLEPGYHEFVIQAAWETYTGYGFYDKTSPIFKKVCYTFEKGKKYLVTASEPSPGWYLKMYKVLPASGLGSDYVSMDASEFTICD